MFNRLRDEKTAATYLGYGLMCVALFLPWRTFPANLSILAAAIAWFVFLPANSKYFTRQTWPFILLLSSVYFVEVIGMIHTEDVRYGLRRLESKLPLLAFPVIVFGSGVTLRQVNRVLLVFVSSTVAACLYCTGVVFVKISRRGQEIGALFTDNEYSNVSLSEPLQRLHPTFLTLFICLSIYVIAEHIRRRRSHYGLIAVILFLIVFAMQLASRAGYAALGCTLVLMGISFIGRKRRWMLVTYAMLVSGALVVSIVAVPTIKKRLVDAVLEADIRKEQSNSVSYHLKTWTCSVESWLNGHVLFGYGTGDEVRTITQCYHDKRWLGHGHDAHNEFLSSLVKHGVVGFLVLVVAFFYPFYLSFRYRDLRYFTFLSIVLISFLSESMLRGQSGLVFFTLFNTLFLKKLLIETQQLEAVDLKGMVKASSR